jgi:regulatory protein
MPQDGRPTLEIVRQKVRHYCAYQERCHSEVESKLRELGVYGDTASEIISGLIAEGFLNEERFACAFAGGKFRQLDWGRVLIRQHLKRKGLNDYLIRKGLAAIDEQDYMRCIQRLAERELARAKGNALQRRQHTLRFLMRKGFETHLIDEVLSGAGDFG